MFGLIGPDGAGKTTAIRLRLRPAAATSPARCAVLGRDPVREHRAVTADVGYLSQRFSLYGDLTIDENIAFFAEIHGVRDYDAARDRLLDMTQLTPFRVAPRRPAVGRDEAEAGARVHAGARARRCCCSTSRRPASTRYRGASSGSCCPSSWRAV